jgi:hypothetical protein
MPNSISIRQGLLWVAFLPGFLSPPSLGLLSDVLLFVEHLSFDLNQGIDGELVDSYWVRVYLFNHDSSDL